MDEVVYYGTYCGYVIGRIMRAVLLKQYGALALRDRRPVNIDGSTMTVETSQHHDYLDISGYMFCVDVYTKYLVGTGMAKMV
jgi:hypothetical protein